MRKNPELLIDEEFGTTVSLVIRFARSTADNGIHSTTGFSRKTLDSEAAEDILGSVSTTFTESHIVFFGTTFVAVTNDLNRFDIFTGFEAFGIFFDGRFGIAADGRFIEVEVGNAGLADRRLNTVLILADFAIRAIFVRQAFGLGNAAVVFANVILRAILGNRLGIALGAAAAITAFLACGAIDANFGIAIAIDVLAITAIADIALILFARTMFVIAAFSTFGIQAVFVVSFFVVFRRAIIVFIALGIGRATTISHTNDKTSKYSRQKTTTLNHPTPP